MNNKSVGYQTLIKLVFFVLFVGGCGYYFYSQPDCIKMTADGSLKCGCFFDTRAKWNDFKDKTKGLNGDGWQSVSVDKNPCEDPSYINLKKAFSKDKPNITHDNASRVPETPTAQKEIDISKFISSFDNFLSDQPFLKSSRINVYTIKSFYTKAETTSRTHIVKLYNEEVYPNILITEINFGFDNANPVFDMGNDNDSFPLSHFTTLKDSSNAILAEMKLRCNGIKTNIIAKSISELLAKKYEGISKKYQSECASCSEDVNQAYNVNSKLFTFEVRYDNSSVVMTCSYKTDYALSHSN